MIDEPTKSPSLSGRGFVFVSTKESILAPVAERLRGAGIPSTLLPVKQIKAVNRRAYSLRNEPIAGSVSFDDWRLAAAELLQTLDRTLLKPLSGKEIIGYFNWLVKLYKAFLEDIPPDFVIIFEHSPHHSWAVAFAHVAESRGNTVLSLEGTLVPRRITLRRALNPERPVYMHASDDEELPFDILRSDEPLSASHRLDQLRHRRMRTLKEQARKWASWWGNLLLLLVSTLVPARRRKKFLRGRWPVDHPLTVAVAMIRAVLKAYSNNRTLKRFGDQDAHRRLAGRYAYLALPYQPERTTEPDCGEYADPLYFLAQVREALDEAGYISLPILVKEHPWQNLQPVDHITLPFRGRMFYKHLRLMKNVLLVHPSVSPDDLIDGARLVVTANGSTAWEGLIRGKPALTARRRWYSQCGATVHLIDERDIKPKLELLLSLDAAAVKSMVTKFLDEERVSVPAPIGGDLSDFDLEVWASAMANALIKRVDIRAEHIALDPGSESTGGG